MMRKFVITYRNVLIHKTVEILATSKYAAKQKFYRMYPRYEIIKIEEVTQ